MQLSVVEVVTSTLGLMVAVPTTGRVFSTVTEAVPSSNPPWASVAVAVQAIVSSGEAVVGLKMSVSPEPRTSPPSLVQA